jgi:glycosyltransferase involved in cell wall biosynthesis
MKRMLPSGLSVVVPAYKSASTLPELVERLGRVLPQLADMHEVILVHDGSGEATWAAVKALAERHEWVRGIDLMRNYGQHNAVLCGVRAAKYDRVVTMDDDLQHPPEELPRLVEALTADRDVVYAMPEHEQHGLWRDCASVVTKLALQTAMGAGNARMVSAWRIFRTRLRDAFADYGSPHVSMDVLLTWGTARFHGIVLPHAPRTLGESNYKVGKLLRHAMNMMTGSSAAPLRLASLVGFAFTLFGAAVLAYVVGRYLLQGSPIPGFPFLASTIAIFSGAQLFALGVIGEYLARMHGRLMEKPVYAVQSDTAERRDGAA